MSTEPTTGNNDQGHTDPGQPDEVSQAANETAEGTQTSAAAAAAAQSGGNLSNVSKFDRQLALRNIYEDDSSVTVQMDESVQQPSKESINSSVDCSEEQGNVECN